MRAVGEECRRWDARYRANPGFFGTAPSPFLLRALTESPDMDGSAEVLCLGEGEGRDAVHLARLGHRVTAVDGSLVAVRALRTRAAEAGLTIEVVRADLVDYRPPVGRYGLVTSFYCHLPPEVRRRVHRDVAVALVPGGRFVMEAFAPAQRADGMSSGGPRDPRLLVGRVDVLGDLAGLLNTVEIFEGPVDIDYGRHRGPAMITRYLGSR